MSLWSCFTLLFCGHVCIFYLLSSDRKSLTFNHLFVRHCITLWLFSFEWSRFIFFEKEKGSKCFLEDSFKESRKQLCAVATALHLPEEDAAEYIVNTTLLDLRDVQETEDHQDDVDESRYDDISSVEDSDIEDGQQGQYDYESSRCHSDSEILMSPIAQKRY